MKATISLAESLGLEPIDWRSVCEHFRDDDNYVLKELEVYTDKAFDWKQCAVGQLPVEIVRGECFYAPLDTRLGGLGGRFAAQFEDRDFEKALDTLNEIEAHANEILTGE